MSCFTVSHRKENKEFYDVTVLGVSSLKHTCDFIAKIPEDEQYQYFVTEWDEDDNIYNQENADEWLENIHIKE